MSCDLLLISLFYCIHHLSEMSFCRVGCFCACPPSHETLNRVLSLSLIMRESDVINLRQSRALWPQTPNITETWLQYFQCTYANQKPQDLSEIRNQKHSLFYTQTHTLTLFWTALNMFSRDSLADTAIVKNK